MDLGSMTVRLLPGIEITDGRDILIIMREDLSAEE